MRLKNKRTGEIGDIAQTCYNAIIVYYPIVDGVAINPQHRAIYKNLTELNEEWEDYHEEPKWLKDYWFIDSCGSIIKQEDEVLGSVRREIGNYFETEEEAEKAVEKLKAWTLLKDECVEITGWETLCGDVCITTNLDILDVSTRESAILDLLFGGEE